MDDRSSSPRPVVWSVAGDRSVFDAQADLRAFDAFAVVGCVANGPAAPPDADQRSEPALVADRRRTAPFDALPKGPQPAAIKTSLPSHAASLRALVQTVDRLRAQDPLLALVVDAQMPAATVDRELLLRCMTELLPRATLVTLNTGDVAMLLGSAPVVDATGAEAAARALRERTGCRGVVIHGGNAAGVEPGRHFMLTEQAEGWLLPPAAPAAPATCSAASAGHLRPRAWFSASAAAALARGFVTTDAVVLATMAATYFQRHSEPADSGGKSAGSDDAFALDPANLPALSSSPSAPAIRFAPLAQPQMDLYAVVDSAAWVQRMLDSGVRTVQLRIKDPAHPALRDEIRASVAAAKAVQAQLFINDHWQLALEENAYGVHLGQEDLAVADLARLVASGLRLGISTHAYWEVCRAAALRPSYIACGPIHPTAAKAMPWIAQGNDNLAYWCALLRAPVVAIAGMDFERAAQAVRCGADAVAVISGITAAASPEQAVQGFAQSIASARQLPGLPPPALARPTLARQGCVFSPPHPTSERTSP